jgi:hypothetical protein
MNEADDVTLPLLIYVHILYFAEIDLEKVAILIKERGVSVAMREEVLVG